MINFLIEISAACRRARFTQIASLPGDIEIDVSFRNVGGASLSLFWVDFDGNEVFQASFSADQIISATSYVNHVWRLRTDALHMPIYEVLLRDDIADAIIDVGHGCYEPGPTFTSTSTYSLISEANKHATAGFTSPCDVSPWISRYVEVPGYHIVCLSGVKNEAGDYILYATFWANGHRIIDEYKYQDLLNPSWSDFREYVESVLDIRNTDTKLATAKYEHTYLPLPWAVYDMYNHMYLIFKFIM